MVKIKPSKSEIRKIVKGKWLSLFYLVVFVAVIMANFIFGSFYYSGDLREGDISLRSIFAPYDFRYPWGIDEGKTEAAKNGARSEVPLIYSVDNQHEEKVISNLTDLFNGLDALKKASKAKRAELLKELKKNTGYDVPDKVLLYFAYRKDREVILSTLIDILGNIYPFGIMNTIDAKELAKSTKTIKIINKRLLGEHVLSIDELITTDKARNLVREYADKKFSHDKRLKGYSLEVLLLSISPNVVFDKESTQAARDIVAAKTPVIYKMVDVKKNEVILEQGKRITRENIIRLMHVGIIGGVTHRWPYFSGLFVLISLFLVLIGIIYFAMTEKKLLNQPKEVLIILVNSLIVILAGQFIIQSSYNNFLIPMAGISILITLLVSPNAAFVSCIMLSLLFGLIAKEKMSLTIVFIVSSFAGIYIAKDARRRSKIILAGIISGTAASIAIIALGLVNNIDPRAYLDSASWGFIGGIISIFFVMGMLPIFEYIFKATTNITLLEMSDLNHPILKDLTLKAPGTYQHSIMVGNLAEAACDSIGANALLARVGAYYHDIGKMEKAEYFSENEVGGISKHDKLTPSMSALIIVNHVKDGIELARKHKMNPKIIEFIEEHHGTGLIYYFYQRALEKVEEDHVLREEEFRYPGPKPQTKETAIVLLADSVEASSRALEEPTPARIVGLVQKIINNKFIDNQLDECDLTLKDLNKIAEAFVRVLTAIFHTRLQYPDVSAIQAKRNTRW